MRISRDVMLMDIAGTVATRATCSRQSVGVVIARHGRVLSTGYNGSPEGMPHCDHACNCSYDDHHPSCASQQPCLISVHAECNAIAWAARWGVSTDDAELFTTFSPCLPCGQLIVNAGIKRVVWGREHRDIRGLELCRNAGLQVDCLLV